MFESHSKVEFYSLFWQIVITTLLSQFVDKHINWYWLCSYPVNHARKTSLEFLFLPSTPSYTVATSSTVGKYRGIKRVIHIRVRFLTLLSTSLQRRKSIQVKQKHSYGISLPPLYQLFSLRNICLLLFVLLIFCTFSSVWLNVPTPHTDGSLLYHCCSLLCLFVVRRMTRSCEYCLHQMSVLQSE